ncbi:MAG: YebC/PmpR family DNA-binding transcriptional regulator [Bacteroidales bacterium]|jgi:YebC/PmpR family DNA-binding regulatory protein|nr:YebC/PmpR family DNA-binding transcriptional regulator [Bacteroidales bacterium]MBP5135106.1 YebC/PmpR family DNA-binding transcriptional regulator [Paludibacteraceae bacterium]MBR6310951.1 YebC/PmpR family DNA-binding transcriptional regulator [Paludibacteraceae bacterium]MDD6357545.1 YebC/PmpR family DNA-binding transcriptional regulator [Bacteroidales bacterium]
MGRAFEYRKATKLKRWGNMARVFTKLGKQITIAAKDGGADPDTNPRLRMLVAQAKKENMPKDNVERAIKRAFSKDESDYKEMNYEGYAPHGIALFIETTTDNTTRTVANIRSYFNKNGGSLGTSGSVEFMFEHKCIFRVESKEGISMDDLELELIDCGIDEVDVEDNEIVIYADFAQNSAVQKYLEDNGFEIISSEFVRIPTEYKELPEDQRESVMKLIEKIEDDDDVQNVYHNMKVDEE